MKTLTRKNLLLASAATAVLGLGMTATPALAFDEVNWTWDKTVTENVVNEVTATVDVFPSGMTELEKLQVHVGDVNASSNVTGFTNNPPGEGGGEPAPAPIPETYVIDLQAIYDDNALDNPITSVNLLNGGDTGLTLDNGTGNVDNNNEEINMTFDLTVPAAEFAPVPIEIGERDAFDLPQVASAATAVGNNQNIESSVSTALHDGQFLIGGFAEDIGEEDVAAFLGTDIDSGNSHLDIAAGLALAAAEGLITPATVSADSTVSGILNATVDSQATAVGNNMSVDLAAFTPDDAFAIADVTQVAYADVTATSLVDDVTLEGYSGMGAAGLGPVPLDEDGVQIPAINSVATAVGNNFSLKVSSPEL